MANETDITRISHDGVMSRTGIEPMSNGIFDILVDNLETTYSAIKLTALNLLRIMSVLKVFYAWSWKTFNWVRWLSILGINAPARCLTLGWGSPANFQYFVDAEQKALKKLGSKFS